MDELEFINQMNGYNSTIISYIVSINSIEIIWFSILGKQLKAYTSAEDAQKGSDAIVSGIISSRKNIVLAVKACGHAEVKMFLIEFISYSNVSHFPSLSWMVFPWTKCILFH